MNEEPLPPDAAPPSEATPFAPCPPHVRVVGALAMLMGLSLPAAAAVALIRFPEQRVLGYVSAGLALLGAMLLLVGGSAFLARARWGRILLALYAWTAWPAAAGLMLAAAREVADEDAPAGLYHLYAGIALGAWLFALVLALALLFGRIAAWGDGAPGPRPEGPSTQSTLALLSLIFAFTPPWGLMTLTSLLLGTMAIGRIRRARGGLHGRGLAIAGISVTGGIFALGFLAVVGATFYVAQRGTADEHAARRHLRELALVQRLHGELDWDHDGRENPCTTTLTALLDADPTHGASGPFDAESLRALRAADYGVLGDSAEPVSGYVFRLEAERGDFEGGPRWAISARPWKSPRAEALRVDERGEPWQSGGAAVR